MPVGSRKWGEVIWTRLLVFEIVLEGWLGARRHQPTVENDREAPMRSRAMSVALLEPRGMTYRLVTYAPTHSPRS